MTNPVLRALWQMAVLPIILLRLRADVLFCPGGVVLTPVFSRCRVVTMFRNMIPFDPRARLAVRSPGQRVRNWFLRHILLRSMRRADLTIFISQYGRTVVESLTSVRAAETIYHGVNPLFSNRNQQPFPKGETLDQLYLLYVSRFDVYKHQCELIEAYAALPSHLRAQHPLVLVGEDENNEAQRARSLISALGVEKDVRIEGAVPYERLPNYYRNAYVNIFMLSCENCPNILLEAMGASQPILCSDVEPMPEFAGDAALLVDPWSVTSIELGLLKVLEEADLRGELARRARVRSAFFDWDVTAKRTWLALAGRSS